MASREMEKFLQLQRSVSAVQQVSECLRSLFEIQSLLFGSTEEQLINTIYVWLVKEFHSVSQGVQFAIYEIFRFTSASKFGFVINKAEVLEMLQDHMRSLDAITRTLAAKIIADIAVFYQDSIESFHIVCQICVRSTCTEERQACVAAIANFLLHAKSHDFSLRFLESGADIYFQIGEKQYLEVLEQISFNHIGVQERLFDQMIDLTCKRREDGNDVYLSRRLGILVRLCQVNPQLAENFFSFVEENLDEFASESPNFINREGGVGCKDKFTVAQTFTQSPTFSKKHLVSQTNNKPSGFRSFSEQSTKTQALDLTISQNSLSLQINPSTIHFSLKLKQLGSSLTSMLKKKQKSLPGQRRQAAVISAVHAIFKFTKHLSIAPSHTLNESILKCVSKPNIAIVKEYVHLNEDIDKTRFQFDPLFTSANSSKHILLSIEMFASTENIKPILSLLENDEYGTVYIEKNSQSLIEASRNAGNNMVGTILQAIGKVILSANSDLQNQIDFVSLKPKLLCAFFLLSGIRDASETHVALMQLFKEKLLCVFVQCFQSDREVSDILALIICQILNKLPRKERNILRGLLRQQIMIIFPTTTNIQQKSSIRRLSNIFASSGLYSEAYGLLTLLKEELGNTKESSIHFSFVKQLLSVYNEDCLEKSAAMVGDPEKLLCGIYDAYLISSLSSDSFEMTFLKFLLDYHTYLLESQSARTVKFSNLLEQINLLLSLKFNIDSSSRSSMRFTRGLLLNIQDYESQLSTTEKRLFAPNFSRSYYHEEFDEEEEEEVDYKEGSSCDKEGKISQFHKTVGSPNDPEIFVDGRSAIIRQVLSGRPESFLRQLQHLPLVIPRCVFVKKRQPVLILSIIPLAETKVRAQRGVFLTGEVRREYTINMYKALKKGDINIKVQLKKKILSGNDIIVTIQQHRLPKSSSLQHTQPFATLITFPHIGEFIVEISAQQLCPFTGKILFQKESDCIHLTAN